MRVLKIKQMAQHNELGKKGEEFALQYLLQKGCRLIECNWRYKHEEVDLIVMDDDELVFVEVKTRSAAEHASADDVISNAKIRHLIEAAEQYVMSHKLDVESRFDAIVLVAKGPSFELEHIRSAFTPNY